MSRVRAFSLLALALAVAGLVAFVVHRGEEAAAPQGAPPRIDVAGLPATFVPGAVWQARIAAGSTVDAADPGVAVVQRRNGAFTVGVLDPQTGRPQWESREIRAAQVPRIQVTVDDGRPWLLLGRGEGVTETVEVYDANAYGRDVQPVHQRTFEGDAGRVPVVTIAERGVLVTETKGGAAYVFRSASGVAQVFATTGQVPVRSYGSGVLVTAPGGFGLVTEGGGWRSADHAPGGVRADSGRVIDASGAYVAAAWTGETGEVLALHDVLSGRVRVASPLPAADASTRKDWSFLVARDTGWATYGPLAVNLRTGATTTLPGGPYRFTQIHDGVAYGWEGDGGRSAAPSSGSSPSSGQRRRAVTIDLLAGEPFPGDPPSSVPVDFDGFGHGLVVADPAGADESGTLYAVPLKRWQS